MQFNQDSRCAQWEIIQRSIRTHDIDTVRDREIEAGIGCWCLVRGWVGGWVGWEGGGGASSLDQRPRSSSRTSEEQNKIHSGFPR